MGWKSTREISREKLEAKILEELNDINNLSDYTLCEILEAIGDDENSNIYSGYNYMVNENSEDEI